MRHVRSKLVRPRVTCKCMNVTVQCSSYTEMNSIVYVRQVLGKKTKTELIKSKQKVQKTCMCKCSKQIELIIMRVLIIIVARVALIFVKWVVLFGCVVIIIVFVYQFAIIFILACVMIERVVDITKDIYSSLQDIDLRDNNAMVLCRDWVIGRLVV